MKIRDRFLISLPLYGALLVLISVVFSFYHLVDFNSTYMKEERSELKVFYKQIEWVVKPYLEKSDFKSVKKYCKTFLSVVQLPLITSVFNLLYYFCNRRFL